MFWYLNCAGTGEEDSAVALPGEAAEDTDAVSEAEVNTWGAMRDYS